MSGSKLLSADECREKLVPFALEKIEFDSSEEIGKGAYGAVFEVTVNGVPCIAKRVHEVLVDRLNVSRRERKGITEQFLRECVCLSELKHPNIVHFIGVHYRHGPDDVSLVMERLNTDVGKFMENTPNLPLSIKVSILCDVSYGLVYLHDKNILHRDLTANNIILTMDLHAKIADLGVSKMITIQHQVALAQTKAPGALNYMPPEALKENPKYNQKLDIFSFGHLSIYVAIQEFPNVYVVTITPAVLAQGTHQRLRRRKALDKVGEDHCLYALITSCLSDLPEKRPSTNELNVQMKQLSLQNPRSMQNELMQQQLLQRDTSVGGSGAPDLSRGGPDREQHGTRGGMGGRGARGGRGGGNTSKNFQQLLQQQQQQLLQRDIGEKEADAGRQRLRRHRYEPEHEKLAEKLALERSKHDEEKRKIVKEHEELNGSLLKELEKQREANKRLKHKIEITAAELNRVSVHSKDQSQKLLASAQGHRHEFKSEQERHDMLSVQKQPKKEASKFQKFLGMAWKRDDVAKAQQKNEMKAAKKERDRKTREEKERRKREMASMDEKSRLQYLEGEIARLEEENNGLKNHMESSDAACAFLVEKLDHAEVMMGGSYDAHSVQQHSHNEQKERYVDVQSQQRVNVQSPRGREGKQKPAHVEQWMPHQHPDLERKHSVSEPKFGVPAVSSGIPPQENTTRHYMNLTPREKPYEVTHLSSQQNWSSNTTEKSKTALDTSDPNYTSKSAEYVNQSAADTQDRKRPVRHPPPPRSLKPPKAPIAAPRSASMDTGRVYGPLSPSSDDYTSLPENWRTKET